MIYLKTEQFDGKIVNVEIYEDEFYTMCPGCSKETLVEFEDLVSMLNEGLDFSSTTHFCNEKCLNAFEASQTKEVVHLKRIK